MAGVADEAEISLQLSQRSVMCQTVISKDLAVIRRAIFSRLWFPLCAGICATCGLRTMRGFGRVESATYGVFVACERAGCGRFVKQAAGPSVLSGWRLVARCIIGC